MSAMNLEIVSRDVSTDIGDLPVIQCALYTVKNRLVTEVLDSVSHVPPDFGETPVHSRVHHFVMRESVARTMVTVHRDARQDGMGKSAIKYAALDVKMVNVIGRVGFVLMDAIQTGQGIIVTVSVGKCKLFAIILIIL